MRSLYGLLGDMEKNTHLVTREHIFAAEGLEYDYEKVRDACYQYRREQEKAGREACYTPQHLIWYQLEERHKKIDKLSRVDESNRTPEDSVHTDTFVGLKKKLEICDGVITYVNKFIAHAATPGSRAIENADELGITLGHLWGAHEAIYKVANVVSIYLLGGSSLGGLPVPQYNQFKYIDRPLVRPEDIPKLHDVWKKYER